MSSAFLDYFRCPPEVCNLGVVGDLPAEAGFFRLGNVVCYGRQAVVPPAALADGDLRDVSASVGVSPGGVSLPFDVSEVATNLRLERYHQPDGRGTKRLTGSAAVRAAYYLVRPLLPVGVRKHLQKAHLSDWRQIAFPRWPVDTSVDDLMQAVMEQLLKSRDGRRVPLVWFWPEGAKACAIVTHDVEGELGLGFCDTLMDIDDEGGMPSSFQIIPEVRTRLSEGLVKKFRDRGFEVNVHDLDHDGHLFSTREIFLERAARINRYAREYGCRGFRAGVMYRNQEWFEDLEFSYDMSVPNVAHLDPQRGGCCTVMPYFVGRVLELPLTTVQDYSLFNILDEYSLALWKEQIAVIVDHNGLVSLNTHPDYLMDDRARQAYVGLLGHLRELRDRQGLWLAQPGQVDDWWRARSGMKVVTDGDSWRVEGQGSDRARLAYAKLDGDRVVYEVGAATDGPR